MNFLEFKEWFDSESSRLTLPKDCSADESPNVKITSSLVWTFQWHLLFFDKKYIRIWEHYGKHPGLQDSRRVRFAFHYGYCNLFAKDGSPEYEPSDPVDIRIDDIHEPAHLHFLQPNPHYQQSVVNGVQLDRMDMFTFIKTILKHRETGKPINEIMGFRIG